MRVPPIKITVPTLDRARILTEIDAVLRSGQLTLGKHGQAFEEAFARYVGVKHAIGTNSGMAGLEIIWRVLDIKGKEVLVPTNTFVATPAAVLRAGGSVKFLDIEEVSFSLDVEALQAAITPHTKAVVLVHIGGFITPNIHEIQRICQEEQLLLVEDAAHAHGSAFDGIKAGGFGTAAAFSFYPTKVITSGEGGMLVTNDPTINERARILRDQGKVARARNVHVELGGSWRMSELHAILGIYQLKQLDAFITARNEIASLYTHALEGDPRFTVITPALKAVCNYYKYMVLINPSFTRSRLKAVLKERYGITLPGEVYAVPCHLQPVFKPLDYIQGDFPIAEAVSSRHLCLPIYPGMPKRHVRHVIKALKQEVP